YSCSGSWSPTLPLPPTVSVPIVLVLVIITVVPVHVRRPTPPPPAPRTKHRPLAHRRDDERSARFAPSLPQAQARRVLRDVREPVWVPRDFELVGTIARRVRQRTWAYLDKEHNRSCQPNARGTCCSAAESGREEYTRLGVGRPGRDSSWGH
ncbi:hypothetical protein B0H14DRAFT_3788210, partial [Mycena olivaceomarginata]